MSWGWSLPLLLSHAGTICRSCRRPRPRLTRLAGACTATPPRLYVLRPTTRWKDVPDEPFVFACGVANCN